MTDPGRPDLWRGRFAQFHDMSGHGLTGVLHGLQRRLAAFGAPDVARISTHSRRVRLDTLGKRPTTLIGGMQTVNPETVQTYAALIITQLIQQLVRLADRSPGRRVPVPVTIYLDEISNSARIPAIEDNIATLRDSGIAFVLGLQDDSGLQQRYGEDAARKIIANLNTKIVLGRNLHIAVAGLEPDPNALADMRGFFRGIAHGKIAVSECERGVPAGWRFALPEGPFVLPPVWWRPYHWSRWASPPDTMKRRLT